MADTRFRQVVALAEPNDDGTSSVQLLKAGNYKHPWFGKLKIDGKLFSDLVRNFNDQTRGVDVAVDVDHDAGEAQGWFRALRLNEDKTELWGDVAWTPPGKQRIADHTYRYMSVEYDGDYEADGKTHGATLLGAALTNRPFIKGMAPVSLSEPSDEGETMNLTAIATALGLSEDADEAAILAKITELSTPPAKPEPTAELTEATAKVTALTEANRTLSERLNSLESERRDGVILAYKEAGKLTDAMLDAGLRALAESNLPAFRKLMDTMPVVVELGERGSSGGAEDAGDPVTRLDTEVRKLMADKQLDYRAALSEVQTAQPALVGAYRDAMRSRLAR